MEMLDYVFITILGGIGLFAVFLLTRNKPKRTKNNKVVGSELLLNENTTHLLQEQKESYESIINGQKLQIKSLQMAVNRYKGIYPDEEEIDENEHTEKTPSISNRDIEENYEIDVGNIIPLIKSMNLPINIDSTKIPDLLNNPFIKNKAWDYIKKNKKMAIELGAIVPIGKGKKVEESPTSENNVQTGLTFDQSNSQHMA